MLFITTPYLKYVFVTQTRLTSCFLTFVFYQKYVHNGSCLHTRRTDYFLIKSNAKVSSRHIIRLLRVCNKNIRKELDCLGDAVALLFKTATTLRVSGSVPGIRQNLYLSFSVMNLLVSARVSFSRNQSQCQC